MSCGACCCTAPHISNFECQRCSVNVQTRAGRTYCTVYYPVGKTLANAAQTSSEVVLLIHGLGGCCKHWEDSEIAPLLASKNCTVVCMDLFTHGKSEKLDNKLVTHDMDLFLTQIYDVIHHPQLPLLSAHKIVMQGFSLGGFLTLNYIAKYHGETACCKHNHVIHKAVFHSPWDGRVPFLLRMLIRTPGLLRLFRPSDMKYIRSNRALKEILLNISKHDKFSERVNDLLNILRKNDRHRGSTLLQNPASTGSNNTITSATSGNVEEMLFIAGSIEIFFSKNAKHLYNKVLKRHSPTDGKKVKDPNYRLRLCPGADHMTFVHCTEGAVGEYFRKELENFICPSYLSSINVDVHDLQPPPSTPIIEEAKGSSD